MKYFINITKCCKADIVFNESLNRICSNCKKEILHIKDIEIIPCTPDEDIVTVFKKNLLDEDNSFARMHNSRIKHLAEQLNINLNDTTPKT